MPEPRSINTFLRNRIMPRLTLSLTEKLKNYKEINDCWIWQGAKLTDGYGMISLDYKTKRVHRVAYEYFVGPIGDKVVCHKCDNPLCINPKHLFLGTQLDNIKDMVSKGRNSNYRGWVGKPKAKLNPAKVKYIRNSTLSYSELARMFNVGANTIKEAKLGITWKKIKEA